MTMKRLNPKRITIQRPVAFIVLVIAVCLCGVIGFRLGQTMGHTTSEQLNPAPDFTIPLYSGGPGNFTLSDHRGSPIVLNFWGAWCPPCRSEFPAIQSIASQFKDKGVLIVGVNAGGIVRDTEREAKDFLAQEEITFFTGPDSTGNISLDYQLTKMPTTFFITRSGTIYKRWEGPITESRLAIFVKELLKL
jgi:peroxiredoxin